MLRWNKVGRTCGLEKDRMVENRDGIHLSLFIFVIGSLVAAANAVEKK